MRSLVRAPVLHQMIFVHGGFTVDHRDGRPAQHGISVCTRPSRTFAFAWSAWNDVAVDGWLAERAGEYGRRPRYIGGWLDPRSDTVWLDVVGVVSPRLLPAACLVGMAMQQHCVFDLAVARRSPCGGARRGSASARHHDDSASDAAGDGVARRATR